MQHKMNDGSGKANASQRRGRLLGHPCCSLNLDTGMPHHGALPFVVLKESQPAPQDGFEQHFAFWTWTWRCSKSGTRTPTKAGVLLGRSCF